ncbi:MAG TPA: hypothetical protein GXZ27_08675 [Thermoanaerobacterales bacterium]|nr:hypothetical protein [Thermoanaerobacterales bacterium]
MLIAFISTIIKEIRDKASIEDDIKSCRTSYVPIPTTSFPKEVGGNHTLLIRLPYVNNTIFNNPQQQKSTIALLYAKILKIKFDNIQAL